MDTAPSAGDSAESPAALLARLKSADVAARSPEFRKALAALPFAEPVPVAPPPPLVVMTDSKAFLAAE
eukprot:874599-Alexandrium_andersonii.AAC.1